MERLTSAPPPGLRGGDHARGPADGPVVVAYADFACPRCAVAHGVLRDGGVRVVFRHFALRAKHPRAVALAHAAEAAARQDAFWPFADALYADQGRLEDPHLWALCEALGLDLERFQSDRRDPSVERRVQRDVREALRAGATATPTLFMLPDPRGPASTMLRIDIEAARRLARPDEAAGTERQTHEQH
jgi:protein-disulfide isomerase